jgi:serine/threonine protein kinase
VSSESVQSGETLTNPTIGTSVIGAHPELTATLDSGTREGIRFGNYTLERKLGSGGMGEVYAATRLGTADVVALKTLSRISATHIYRFKREFRALADVAHDNLIKLFELGVGPENRTFFTMELLDGEPFVSWVRRGPIGDGLPDLARLEAALRQLVAGVMCLHDNGCVHRDLKPSNVLVTPTGRVVILDFGLISELGEPEHGVTRDGQLLGTPIYMAPEQALAEPAGPEADFYAVGVMLYECLTGKPPHTGSLNQLLADKQRSLDLDVRFSNLPERWRDLCVELLERDPKRRLDGSALMARLDASTTNASTSAVMGEVFVGRREELAKLHEAYADLGRTRAPVIVHLRGRSG